ncbi:MAG TPA: molybdate ABC transporter substrate-binding protein [Opitutus sp.]|nr:molybdate ABC transporter substrate-binding protein [Opitutus sp.]
MKFFALIATSVSLAGETSAPSRSEMVALAGTPAPTLSIAAASNLVYVLDELTTAFRVVEPQVAITVATGASGSLVAQIQNGAPFDVFLSADLIYPQSLVDRGHANAKTLTTFATGRLVLWTTKTAIKLGSIEDVLRNRTVRRIAVANPDTAPYGHAAKSVLEQLGLWNEVQPKVVLGETITQTAQFVETGNADVGFVALSLVLSPKLKNRGQWMAVPHALYSPVAQGAVITRKGSRNAAAARFLRFLHSDAAREIFIRFGYQVTDDSPNK